MKYFICATGLLLPISSAAGDPLTHLQMALAAHRVGTQGMQCDAMHSSNLVDPPPRARHCILSEILRIEKAKFS